jgi:prepilin-type N-terminal cleavage/methylation domain-containing protein
MVNRRSSWRGDAGMSLIEVLVALCITAILASMAVVQIGAARPALQADGAMRAMMSQLNAARETAVAQRRNIQLVFTTPNQLQLVRQNLPTGTTVLRTVALEAGVRYHLFAPVVDTPDNFGVSGALSFNSALTITFNSDGMLIDSGGSPINGTIFLAQPSARQSARAVTILGATGRVRGYRWTGSAWAQV